MTRHDVLHFAATDQGKAGIATYRWIYCSGGNPTQGTTVEGLWANSSAWSWPPAAGEAMHVVSTSPSDDSGGVGVTEVRIEYLTAAGAVAGVTVTTDGTVQAPSGISAKWIIRCYATAWGTTGSAVGSIDARGPTPTIYERIPAGARESRSAKYMTPAGKKSYVYGFHAYASSGQNATVYLETDVDESGISGSPSPFPMLAQGSGFATPAVFGGYGGEIKSPLVLPAGNKVAITGQRYSGADFFHGGGFWVLETTL